MMLMITVDYAAHAPVVINTAGYARIDISPEDIRVRHDGKTEVFPTAATRAVVSVVVAQ
ncbi:MAG TPA: hypothetical protein VGR63_02465 [Casimicrobiaceae bacterium]|jgi:hypothetical protein|nr:hypothetical protein [Casimicrobiaceae bacterium]